MNGKEQIREVFDLLFTLLTDIPSSLDTDVKQPENCHQLGLNILIMVEMNNFVVKG